MTVDDVLAEVDRIRAMASDYEAAHSAEDALHMAVLSAIAEGSSDAQELAWAAMKTEQIEGVIILPVPSGRC